MLMSNGEGNTIKYVNGQWIIVANGKQVGAFNANGLEITGNTTVAGNVTSTGDVSFGSGYEQSFVFFRKNVLQSEKQPMSASAGSSFTSIPMPRAGSVVGLVLKCTDANVDNSDDGGLTASIAIDGVNQAAKVVIVTGSMVAQRFGKDTYTFATGSTISVALTASSTYLNSLAASGSYMATVLVEM